MNKKVLILCTGNSCRSIIGEALINKELEGVEAYSSGVAPSKRVNPNAKKVLEAHNAWDDRYHSKHLNELDGIQFDLVVTVCDHAHETCPVFPYPAPKIHVGFEDPDGQEYGAFENTYNEIKTTLLPEVKKALKGQTMENTQCDCTEMEKNVSKTDTGVKINFMGAVEKQNIVSMVQNCQNGQCDCMSDTTKAKITNMQISGEDGNVELQIEGDISKEDIEAAMQKSKVLNS